MPERLTSLEVCYVLQNVQLKANVRERIAGIRVDLTTYLDDDEIDTIREALMDRLTVVGFDVEYRPTDEGTLIESLIDKLFIG